MPENLPGKIIITNTVTAGDREMLKKAVLDEFEKARSQAENED